MIGLNDRTALVTGASRGLGRVIALTLGKAGANVVVTDLLLEGDGQTAEDLASKSALASHFAGQDHVFTRRTAEEINAMGGRAMARRLDVTNPADINEALADAAAEFGGVDILVNNAGLMENFERLENHDHQKWQRDVTVNLGGAFVCSQAVWPGMIRRGWGRIINISSIAGAHGAFRQPSYGASKSGMIGLAKSLALEGAGHGITVNTVLPGFIATEAVKLHRPEMLERISARVALKRLGEPEEVASLVCYLCSDLAGYITGAAIPVAGGIDLMVI